ncbi:MAG: hypothetical protein JWN86_1375 [Planctomycetota bacterium]|nr:hypothetical protein [Planctomycetota bacterium]
MKTTTATTFEVSDVVRAKSPLPEVSYKQAVEALLTRGVPEHHRRRVEALARRGLSIALPETPPSRPVEACTRYHGRLLGGVAFHPVVAAVHRAFLDHRPLILSPDTLWLMIAQAVANHVNAHAEELRPRLVRHPGRLTIDVRRDDFVKGSPENPWPEVFAEFSKKVRDHVGPAIDLFVPTFSTTGPVERAASEVVLLDAMRSYFDYALHTLCGIPAIALEGTTEDWQSLAGRAEAFAEFGLARWIEFLRPILRQFVRASRGDVDVAFWRSLYKINNQSGGPVITGWITAFFPYLKDYRTGHASVPIGGFFEDEGRGVEEMLYSFEDERRAFAHGPTIESFPGGLSCAPFRWEYLDKTFPMEFLGGFVGVAQDSGTLALRPEIGWAVREAVASS